MGMKRCQAPNTTQPIGQPPLIVFQILILSRGLLIGQSTHTHTHTKPSLTSINTQHDISIISHSWPKILSFIQHIYIQRQQPTYHNSIHKAATSTRQQHTIMALNKTYSIIREQYHSIHHVHQPYHAHHPNACSSYSYARFTLLHHNTYTSMHVHVVHQNMHENPNH